MQGTKSTTGGRDPRRDSVGSPARRSKVALYFRPVISGMRVSAPHLRIPRELGGGCRIRTPEPTSPPPLCASEGSKRPSVLCQAARCGLAEPCPHPPGRGPPAPPFRLPSAPSSARIRAPDLLHRAQNSTLFGKHLSQLLETPRGSSSGDKVNTRTLAHRWTLRSLQQALLCLSI